MESRTYNVRGLVEFVDVFDAVGGRQSTEFFTYTPIDQVDAQEQTFIAGTASESRKITYTYDPSGRLVSQTEHANGNARFTDTLGYDDADRLTSQTRSGTPQQVMSYAYDSLGRKVSETVQDGGALTTLYAYAGKDRVRTVTDPLGSVTTNAYDAAGRLKTVTDAKGNVTTNSYDANGNLTRIELLAKNDAGAGDRTWVTETDYDALNLPTAVREGDLVALETASVTQYDSLGNAVAITDGNGNLTEQGFDALSRLVETRKYEGAATLLATTSQTYDANGYLATQTDPNGNTTTLTNDSFGNVLTRQYADGTQQTFTYDGLHRMATSTDANGVTIDYTYDQQGRLIGRSSVTAGYGFEESFGYHPLGGVESESRTQDGLTDSVWRTFNARGLVVSEAATLGGAPMGALTTTVGYDGRGGVVSMQYPGGRTFTVGRDDAGMMQTITEGTTEIVDYDYLGRSRVARRAYENDTLTTDFGYDFRGRADAMTHAHLGAAFDDRAFTWDAANNKTFRSASDASGFQRSTAYTYDGLNRMDTASLTVGAAAPVVTDYNHDGAGNRTDVNGAAYTLAAAPGDSVHEYGTTPNESFTRAYDANGNYTGDAGSAVVGIGYNADNLMIWYLDSVTGADEGYRYDASNRRIRIERNGAIDRYFVYLGDRIIEEYTGTGTLARSYVYGNYVDEVLQTRDETSATDHYYFTDDQWNVVALTTAAGSLVERYTYDDFGAPTVMDANWAPMTGNTSAAGSCGHLGQ